MDVVGEAEDGRTLVQMVSQFSPDVVVMDIAMPHLNGIESTRQIRSGKNNAEGPKVIALSAHSERKFMLEMFKAGATGYVVKTSAFEELTLAVQSVMQDKLYLSPSLAEIHDIAPEEDPTSGVTLSPREREVAQLMAEGNATKEIARHLQISAKTVESHRGDLMDKLELDSVAELTKYAIREGITTIDA
jgi:two-component system response regulator NreC